MGPTAYTIARWRVAPGREEEFRVAWVALVETLAHLARPPLCGTLLQHRTDPTLFYSFGPWDHAQDIEEMCHDAAGQDAFLRVAALCVDAEPGVYRLVETIDCNQQESVESEGDGNGVRTKRVRRPLRRASRRPRA